MGGEARGTVGQPKDVSFALDNGDSDPYIASATIVINGLHIKPR